MLYLSVLLWVVHVVGDDARVGGTRPLHHPLATGQAWRLSYSPPSLCVYDLLT
jgi:hypothetical protein